MSGEPSRDYINSDMEETLGAPDQHEPGVCACGARLSTYNPYTVCGPCRVRLAAELPENISEVAFRRSDCDTLVWERYPRRKVIGRGRLIPL